MMMVAMAIPDTGLLEEPIRPTIREDTVAKKKPKTTTITAPSRFTGKAGSSQMATAMTTMATVFRNAPDLKDSGVNVTLMGGALTLPGNVSPAAEANISQDPEAADYLFKCGARTTMIGLDVTHQTALTREKAHEWASLGTQAGDFLVTMTDYYIDFYLKNQPEIRGCGLHDPLAVAAALDPSLVTTFGFNLQVDLEGPFRGRTIGDRSRLQDPDKHTQVALGVNVPEFLDRFMTRVTAAARG